MKRLLPSLTLFGLFASVACSSSSSESSEDTTPPTLEIVALETLSGESLSKPGTLLLACDRVVRLTLGPSESDDGQLDHWDMRPPGDCSDEEQACGYVAVSLATTEEAGAERSFDTVLLDSALTVPPEVEGGVLTVRLMQGNALSPYLVDEEPVEQSWLVRFTDDCASGLGGAGGSAP
jgi:hypothetical protein